MYNITLVGGIGVIAFTTIFALLYSLTGLKIKKERVLSYKERKIMLDDTEISNKSILIYAVVFIVTMALFKNIIISIMSLVVIVLIPSKVLALRKRKRKNEILEQLATAMSIFADNYAVSLNIKESLKMVSDSLTGEVSDIFKDAYYELSYGKKLEEVMKNTANKLGISYGYMFTNLITMTSSKGEVLLPLFYDLVSRTKIAQDSENYKYGETTVSNKFNLGLIIFPVIEYFILLRIVPHVKVLMFETVGGSLLFAAWLLSIIIWIITDAVVSDY